MGMTGAPGLHGNLSHTQAGTREKPADVHASAGGMIEMCAAPPNNAGNLFPRSDTDHCEASNMVS